MVPHARILAVAIATATLAIPSNATAASCPGLDAVPTADSVTSAVAATVCLANEERAAAGVPPLTLDTGLSSAAADYAHRMVRDGFYSHVSPDGGTLTDRLGAIGYHADEAGEDLFWGTSTMASPAGAVDSWMHSRDHRANLLDPAFRRVGIGIAMGTPEKPTAAAATYVADFDSGATATAASSLGGSRETSSAAPARSFRARTPKRAVRAWFEAARVGDAKQFCRLQDNRLLGSLFGAEGKAGMAACAGTFRAVEGLPAASELRFSHVRTRGTRASMKVVARGERLTVVLRKFDDYWKLDSVTR